MQIQTDTTNVNCASGNAPKYIIIHDTGNPSKGANALRHAVLFKNPNLKDKVSYHIVVDDIRAIQCVEFNMKAYHSGKKYGQASVPEANNSNSISISMCVNSDCNKQKAYENLIDVTKQIMKKFNIPSTRVIRHYDACKKHCPEWIMDNKLWDDFKKRLVSNVMEDEDMIPTVRLAACNESKIKNIMVEHIKGLQGCAKIPQTGIATQELCIKLPQFKGGESKGSATILQEILALKGYISHDPKMPPLGLTVKNALDKFKKDMGIPITDELTSPLVWMKLLEY